MQEIFKYINYRKYLADYYQEKKRSTKHFSHRYFAARAGIKSPVFFKQVIDGERNLTKVMIDKFIAAIGLNKKESVFFKNLVLFNQAKSASEKQECYSVMLSMMHYVQEHQLTGDQYAYFEKWYNSALRELVCLYDFQDDFEQIGKTIRPQITATEVKKSIRLLLRLNLIVRRKDGTYRQQDAAIISSNEMVTLSRRSFNSEMLLLAREANETASRVDRNFSGITMGISKESYEVLLTEMAAFRERVKTIVNQDKNSSRVYQLGLHLFPLSDELSSRGNQSRGDGL